MNSTTHKVLTATYSQEVLHAVPIDWDIKQVYIADGTVYYNRVAQDCPSAEVWYSDKYPTEINVKDDFDDWDEYFDCE
tara:strand:- start:329 stop:562 length:234 start_codon:yes stop_codon:yes gene_type:complete